MEESEAAVRRSSWHHHPQVVERSCFTKVENETLGEFLIQNMPVIFSNADSRAASWAAGLGEHSAQVLESELSFSEGEIDRLFRDKVVA